MASTKTSTPKARASKPPTPKSSSSRSRESVDDQRRKSELKPEPLIPKCNRYSHKTTAYSLLGGILPRTARRSIGDTMPDHNQGGICKLVHVMANAALFREWKGLWVDKSWERKFDHALVHYLPVREHHVAFLTHNMFVTMIGAVVARALEQATRGKALNKLGTGANNSEMREHILDLLADRRYVRNIACHDCSKTSEVEDVAYSGIMAVNMTRAYLEESFDRRCRLSGTSTGSRTDASYQDNAAMTTPMANIGFKHHRFQIILAPI